MVVASDTYFLRIWARLAIMLSAVTLRLFPIAFRLLTL